MFPKIFQVWKCIHNFFGQFRKYVKKRFLGQFYVKKFLELFEISSNHSFCGGLLVNIKFSAKNLCRFFVTMTVCVYARYHLFVYSTLTNGNDEMVWACVAHIESSDGFQVQVKRASLPQKETAKWKTQSKFGKIFSCDMKLWLLIESFEILHCAKSFYYATMIMLPESSLLFRFYLRLVLFEHTTSTY